MMNTPTRTIITADNLPEAVLAEVLALIGARAEGSEIETATRPLFEPGLDAEELRERFTGLDYAQRAAVMDHMQLHLGAVAPLVNGDLLFPETDAENGYENWPQVKGGNRTYLVDGEEYTDAESALEACGLELQTDGCWVDFYPTDEDEDEAEREVDENWGTTEEALQELQDIGKLEVTVSGGDYAGAPRPAWGTVRLVDRLPQGMDAQAVYDFTGMVVYERQDADGYVLGVDGGGYDFTAQHHLPLAYLYELLS